jgi:protein phosphatase
VLVVVPDPGLVVLIGAAGSGKTTFAARHFAVEETLGSDAYRAIISGDEADQRATAPAFAALHRQLARRLAARSLTVVDATNVERHARRALLVRARRAGIPATAIIFDLPREVVLGRNAARPGRVVDPAIVSLHLRRLQKMLDRGTIEAEGFEAVYRFRNPDEVEAVTIVRRSGGSTAAGRTRDETERPRPQLYPDAGAEVDVVPADRERRILRGGADQDH